MTRLTLGAAAVAVVLAIFGQPASAATRIVNFDFGPDVASGEFSYDNALTGVIGYEDLKTFSLTFLDNGKTYDLAFVNGPNMSSYRGFAFDTASRSFVLTAAGGTTQILSAINDRFDAGFFIRDEGDLKVAADYADYRALEFSSLAITSRVTGGVPEPTTWALMIGGFGLAGATLRRRRTAWA